MQSLQHEYSLKVQSMKEDIAQLLQKNESLKELTERQEAELAKKTTKEHELEDAQTELLSLRMTNEEYRQTLKAKNSAISEAKRELDANKATNAAKVKELEFNLAAANKRVELLTAENKELLEKVAQMQIA
jgi:chromosome segregation ATPase